MNCPICAGRPEHAYRPFCSKRCADRDLGKWLTGSYTVPSQEPEDIDKAQELADEAARRPH